MEFAAPVFQSWGRQMEQKTELPAGISQSSPKVQCFLREFSLDMSSGRSPPKSAPGNGETSTFFGKITSRATKMRERAFISQGKRHFTEVKPRSTEVKPRSTEVKPRLTEVKPRSARRYRGGEVGAGRSLHLR